MTSLLCPLCGKNTSLKNYRPDSFDLDIYVQDFRGLGRGKGFASLGRRSILHDRTALVPLANRILDLVELLHDEGHIDDSELRERLWPWEASEEDNQDNSAEELGAIKAWREDALRGIGEMADEAYEAAGIEDREEEEDGIEDMRNGVHMLIDEVQALRAKVEDLESG
ncbi:MAG: hypothetical protein HY296_03080 [Thaumarchaeota archaeon]|nr:hypothetical protein [Nitrososphaerota archaeon]